MIRPSAIALLAGLLPLAAAPLAYAINIMAGSELDARFVCLPFTDGCVSVSRAARSGPGLHLFRAVMLPCTVLLALSWHAVRAWLTGLEACSHIRAAAIFWLGVTGALFLALYVTWLGTEGEWYSWLRRYGVTFYFGGTALAHLLLVWVLWPAREKLAGGELRRPIAALMFLVGLQWALGVFSSIKRLLFADPALIDRIENLVEWWFAVPMVLAFIVLGRMFRMTGLQLEYHFHR
jgi:hypothetical protein